MYITSKVQLQINSVRVHYPHVISLTVRFLEQTVVAIQLSAHGDERWSNELMPETDMSRTAAGLTVSNIDKINHKTSHSSTQHDNRCYTMVCMTYAMVDPLLPFHTVSLCE